MERKGEKSTEEMRRGSADPIRASGHRARAKGRIQSCNLPARYTEIDLASREASIQCSMARKSRRTQRLRVVNPDCAGTDIGKDRHFVAVDHERTEEPVRSFGAFTHDLEAMASCGVTKEATQSTSVYWIPVYDTLDRAGFGVMLVPPRMTKQIGRRNGDVLDCQWIWQLTCYGLLRGAFRQGDEVCPLRSCARQMRRLTLRRTGLECGTPRSRASPMAVSS